MRKDEGIYFTCFLLPSPSLLLLPLFCYLSSLINNKTGYCFTSPSSYPSPDLGSLSLYLSSPPAKNFSVNFPFRSYVANIISTLSSFLHCLSICCPPSSFPIPAESWDFLILILRHNVTGRGKNRAAISLRARTGHTSLIVATSTSISSHVLLFIVACHAFFNTSSPVSSKLGSVGQAFHKDSLLLWMIHAYTLLCCVCLLDVVIVLAQQALPWSLLAEPADWLLLLRWLGR